MQRTDEPGAAASRPARRIVGCNPGITFSAGCGLLAVFVLSWGWVSHPLNGRADLVNALPPLCFLATVACLLGTCRIVVDPAGSIDVIDPLVVHRVPVDELAEVEHDDGLHLRLVSGRRVGSVAYGPSLLGALVRYPRSVRAAQRIEAAIDGVCAIGEVPSWQDDSVRREPRVGAYLATLGVNAAIVLGTLLVMVLRRAYRTS